jgi:hypothetical protein
MKAGCPDIVIIGTQGTLGLPALAGLATISPNSIYQVSE